MTAKELQSAIGSAVYFVSGDIKFSCWVKRATVGYGKPRFLIEPIAGQGSRWVELSSLEPIPEFVKTRVNGRSRQFQLKEQGIVPGRLVLKHKSNA